MRTIAEMREARHHMVGSVGLVPTMGYLHEGHLSLVRRARSENDVVVVTIFVNPMQFGPAEDFARYPRDEARDLALLEKEGTDMVFAPPTVEEIYPPGFSTFVDVGPIGQVLEGAFRPGHFRGVATVVAKLFLITEPTRAYFGRKDAQQLVVIKKVVRDLNLNLEVVACPTVREPDGLALSSRNVYLGPQERQAALVLYRSLQLAQSFWAQGERNAEAIRSRMRALIAAEPLAKMDYVSIGHPETLAELDRIEGSALVSLAVRIGGTRLIDNITLE